MLSAVLNTALTADSSEAIFKNQYSYHCMTSHTYNSQAGKLLKSVNCYSTKSWAFSDIAKSANYTKCASTLFANPQIYSTVSWLIRSA
jgi:hypothetical protein